MKNVLNKEKEKHKHETEHVKFVVQCSHVYVYVDI